MKSPGARARVSKNSELPARGDETTKTGRSIVTRRRHDSGVAASDPHHGGRRVRAASAGRSTSWRIASTTATPFGSRASPAARGRRARRSARAGRRTRSALFAVTVRGPPAPPGVLPRCERVPQRARRAPGSDRRELARAPRRGSRRPPTASSPSDSSPPRTRAGLPAVRIVDALDGAVGMIDPVPERRAADGVDDEMHARHVRRVHAPGAGARCRTPRPHPRPCARARRRTRSTTSGRRDARERAREGASTSSSWCRRGGVSSPSSSMRMSRVRPMTVSSAPSTRPDVRQRVEVRRRQHRPDACCRSPGSPPTATSGTAVFPAAPSGCARHDTSGRSRATSAASAVRVERRPGAG